ncbi:MAG TPA: hypothetical protein IAA98_11515 [Candidatus Avipropionibacterium avicola]|uniref:Uncharacterized protein n=1 Tax=Candidatus Avipropionibacterium avicola TaxID=2840701 RepID=A0A9D1GZ45_9ACTN|nr:hypothetical protein [Candidatus Avipropionibacterium avicola]
MVATDTADLPRRVVLDQAWRAAGLSDTVLSGRDGGPLARTVKCLLDPLVIRPRLNPDLATPVLDPAAATRLRALLDDHVDLLRATDGWYGHLKRVRRERGIRSGNPQELYFPRAWELAHRWGPATEHPDPSAAAAEVIDEVHPPDGLDPSEVAAHLGSARVRSRLERELQDRWIEQDVPSDLTGAVTVVAEAIAVLLTDGTDPADVGPDPEAMAVLGVGLHDRPGVLQDFATALGVPAVALSAHDPVPPPPVEPVEGSDPLPLDRSLRTRVVSAVRRAPEAAATIEEAVAVELDRAVAPWGLTDPDWHRVLLVGIAVAGQLRPLAERSQARGMAAQIDARLRKEAYVLHSRRLVSGQAALHPAQQAVVDALAEFWRPYLSRLWVRLHGLDVAGGHGTDRDRDASWRDLVTGIARSVSLDQRTRIRTALERGPWS